jgi:hypothetical protein
MCANKTVDDGCAFQQEPSVRHLNRLLLFSSVLFLCSTDIALSSGADVPSTSTVFNLLKGFDAVYLSSLDITAQETKITPRPYAKAFSSRCRFHLCLTRDISVVQESARRIPTSQAFDVAPAGAERVLKGLHANLRSIAPVTCISLYANDYNAEILGSKFCDGEERDTANVQDSECLWLVRLCAPVSPRLDFTILRLKWCLGRGFSHQIDDISSIEQIDKRSINVTAIGKGVAGATGTWQLIIDLGADYLVRSAKFYGNGDSDPEITVVTTGELRNDELTVPKSSVWTDNLLGTPEQMPVNFDTVSSTPDPAFLKKMRSYVVEKVPANTTVVDYRYTPPLTTMLHNDESYSPNP